MNSHINYCLSSAGLGSMYSHLFSVTSLCISLHMCFCFEGGSILGCVYLLALRIDYLLGSQETAMSMKQDFGLAHYYGEGLKGVAFRFYLHFDPQNLTDRWNSYQDEVLEVYRIPQRGLQHWGWPFADRSFFDKLCSWRGQAQQHETCKDGVRNGIAHIHNWQGHDDQNLTEQACWQCYQRHPDCACTVRDCAWRH